MSSKQPYMPLYIGDYIKDTRILPLNARGAWSDILMFMWTNIPRGEITARIDEYSRLLGATLKETSVVINTITGKNICDHETLPDGSIRLISRRMKKDLELSKMRSEIGKKGGNPNLVNQKSKQNKKLGLDFDKPKIQANSDIDNDNEIKKGRRRKKNSESVNTVLPEKLQAGWERWKNYKRQQFKFSYKSADSERLAIDSLMKISGGDEAIAEKIIDQSIANGWKGLFEMREAKIDSKWSNVPYKLQYDI